MIDSSLKQIQSLDEILIKQDSIANEYRTLLEKSRLNIS
jgi:hypothetical protein